MPTKQTAPAQPTTPTVIDPSRWNVNTDRERPKRAVGSRGVDREPLYKVLRALKENQIVELPDPLTEEEAKKIQNVVRAAATDLNLAISFLTDNERNAQNGKRPEGTSYYAWFVKGPYQKRKA